MEILIAQTKPEILKCYPVMKELRTHITDEEDFGERVMRQMKEGYSLAYFVNNGSIHSVAGFRFGEFLAWGKIMYVDDLVTAESGRSKGYGRILFDWLIDYARKNSCHQLHLDSGVQRFGAHRFYLRNGMDITSHHFAIKL